MRLTIGEFSRLTSLTLKQLRLYHEKGILVPSDVDRETGYRFYDEHCLDRARSLKALKDLDFTLAEIGELLDDCDDEAEMLPQLEAKLRGIEREIDRYEAAARSIRSILDFEKESAMTQPSEFEIEEREVDTVLIAGHRMRGRYQDVGKGLGLVCKKMGRHVNGKPMTLYYDDEYKDDEADFEPCVPVRKGQATEKIDVRELPGGHAVTLVHKGPYDTLSSAYQKVFAYMNEKGYRKQGPIREVYRKGPGMILKGNPKNYLTEIVVLVDAE